MIIYGTHKFGWVDKVEGFGCVATRFAHIMYIPLFPLGSMFMTSDDSGYTMPMQWKSVFVAYFRAALFWGAFASWATLPLTWGLSCCTAVPLTVVYFVFPLLFRKASESRERELREMFGG